ncbi:MAG: hypothetical protein K2N16_09470 [Muribaculaceae bacterium]|nr:hypothetical protein [Muribaculaceae bacterium]
MNELKVFNEILTLLAFVLFLQLFLSLLPEKALTLRGTYILDKIDYEDLRSG